MQRWYRSRTIWLNILSGLMDFITIVANLGAAVVPQALPLLATLSLTPSELMIWTVLLNLFVKGANIFLRFNSPTAIVSKVDHEAFIDMTDRALEEKEYL